MSRVTRPDNRRSEIMPSSWSVQRFNVAFGLAIVVGVTGAPQTPNGAVEREVRDSVDRYMAGYASNTVEGYFDNYADDVTYWWPNGLRQQRDAYHQLWADTLAAGNTVTASKAEDVRVHTAPAGDAGVASFVWKISRKVGDPYALQTSTTWFKRQGRWRIVHMHFNRIGSPGSRGAQQPSGRGSAGGGTPTAVLAAPPPPPTSGPGREVRDTIAKLTESFGSNDLDSYFALFADDLTSWGPNGQSDKESYRRWWTDSAKTGGLSGADTADLRIQVSPQGDLAVASYLLNVTRKNAGDTLEHASYEMSPTLIKRNGRWQIVHLHFQTVPPPRSTSGH
jgi:ketosteroid isomerase-like protein